jgi:hypothetical protein
LPKRPFASMPDVIGFGSVTAMPALWQVNIDARRRGMARSPLSGYLHGYGYAA